MAFLTRRKMIAGASASAAAALAGCSSATVPAIKAAAITPPPPPPPAASPVVASAGDFKAMYGEMNDGQFTVPAVKAGQVGPAFVRKSVTYATSEAPGTIVIDPANHYLYHVEEGGRATRYGVGVGREGFVWAGEATIKSKQEWPDWYPPKEMIERRPDLKRSVVELQSGVGMHGGPSNPLGARAMYLWQGDKDTLFRIHGTNEPSSIGHSEFLRLHTHGQSGRDGPVSEDAGRHARRGARLARGAAIGGVSLNLPEKGRRGALWVRGWFPSLRAFRQQALGRRAQPL